MVFYTRYNPASISKAAELAKAFLGREDELNRLLREKYGNDLTFWKQVVPAIRLSTDGSGHAFTHPHRQRLLQGMPSSRECLHPSYSDMARPVLSRPEPTLTARFATRIVAVLDVSTNATIRGIPVFVFSFKDYLRDT